jgi:hypothetical protein
MNIFGKITPSSDATFGPSPLVLGICGLIAFVIVYWFVGQLSGSVNATLLPSSDLPPGSSHIVDVNARILERELNTGWAPSAHFNPIWVRSDLPGFQEGILDVVTKSTQELNNIFRTGSESVTSDDLKEAANDINRPANGWSVFSSNSTADRLSNAVKRLDRVNAQLVSGKFPALNGRIDLVASQINDYVILLSDEHTKLEQVAASNRALFGVRYPFFRSQGVLTGVCLQLKAVRMDFEKVLEMQSALSVFDQATEKACETLGVKPLPVVNGSGYSFFGGNVKNLSGQIGTVLYNLAALQSAIAAAPSRNR